jgi:hypothetical protein
MLSEAKHLTFAILIRFFTSFRMTFLPYKFLGILQLRDLVAADFMSAFVASLCASCPKGMPSAKLAATRFLDNKLIF